jgi:hypothetical protein
MPCACQIPVPTYPETADWGPILWTILHGLAEKSQRAALPEDEIREWQKFIKLTGEMLPCDKCRVHYSAFSTANPPTQLSKIPYTDLKRWIKSWFFTLHNEVNVENGKPLFVYTDLVTAYANPNFQDLFWRLEPVMKKAIQLSGVSLMKWTSWVHSYKMLKSILAI